MTNYENWTVTAVFSTFRVFSAMNLYVIDINEYLATVCMKLEKPFISNSKFENICSYLLSQALLRSRLDC